MRTLVDFDTWSTALEVNLAGMMSSELAVIHYFDDFEAPGFAS